MEHKFELGKKVLGPNAKPLGIIVQKMFVTEERNEHLNGPHYLVELYEPRVKYFEGGEVPLTHLKMHEACVIPDSPTGRAYVALEVRIEALYEKYREATGQMRDHFWNEMGAVRRCMDVFIKAF